MSNSIGDLRNSGNQGNNFPWQLKVLQGLQAIASSTNAPLTCVDQVTVCGTTFSNISGISALNVNVVNPIPLDVIINEANDSILVYGNDGTTNRKIKTDAAGSVSINDGGNSITVDSNAVVRTPTFLRPAGTDGTVAAGTYSMSFASVGTANATVGGITLKPGETINFDAGAINNTLGAVSYITSANAGAELIIITLT
jgi:hypothetical protein